jgi:hypothetical protein
MTILKVTTDSKAHARQLAKFLKTIEYVRNISVEEQKDFLLEEDWIIPGRNATDAELDQLLVNMDKDDDTGLTTEQMLSELKTWKRKSI